MGGMGGMPGMGPMGMVYGDDDDEEEDDDDDEAMSPSDMAAMMAAMGMADGEGPPIGSMGMGRNALQ